MKTRHPFLALLKMEFLRSSMAGQHPFYLLVPLILFIVCVTPALQLWLQPQRADTLVVLTIWAMLMTLCSLILLSVECPVALARQMWGVLPGTVVPNYNWDEFVSSRAIDRRLHFRAKTVMFALVLVLPHAFNVALVCLISGQFPASAHGIAQATSVNSLVVSNTEATAAFAYGVFWASAAVIVLAQGYSALTARLVGQSKPGIILAVGLPVVLMTLSIPRMIMNDEFILSLARFFVAHWLPLTALLFALALPVQWYCERCFADQEVL